MSIERKDAELGRLLTSDEGFEWDVSVQRDPARYDAKTIMRMVKQVNRRGRVRWFEVYPDGDELRWAPSVVGVTKGIDDLATFVGDVLDQTTHERFNTPTHFSDSRRAGDVLIISFEDRSDARAFSRDLSRLSVSSSVRERLLGERDSQRKFVEQFVPRGYFDVDWPKDVVPLIKPEELDPSDIDTWMRRNMQERYRAGLLRADGTQEWASTGSHRYWRINVSHWENLIGRMLPGDHLLAGFVIPHDRDKFDARYGPGQLLR